jgi:hypothetical protein
MPKDPIRPREIHEEVGRQKAGCRMSKERLAYQTEAGAMLQSQNIEFTLKRLRVPIGG